MDMFTGLLGKVTGWIDQLFSFFGLYSTKYSKWIVWIIALFIASKIFKIKLNLGGGKR